MGKLTKLQQEEKNDCVVRSIMNIYGITYNQAHAFCKDEMGRVDKKGVNRAKWEPVILRENFGHVAKPVGEEINGVFGLWTKYENVRTKSEIVCQMTVGTFLKEFSKGTYFINVRKHAFVVKDGEVIGNSEDAAKLRVIVKSAYKVVEAELQKAAK